MLYKPCHKVFRKGAVGCFNPLPFLLCQKKRGEIEVWPNFVENAAPDWMTQPGYVHIVMPSNWQSYPRGQRRRQSSGEPTLRPKSNPSKRELKSREKSKKFTILKMIIGVDVLGYFIYYI